MFRQKLLQAVYKFIINDLRFASTYLPKSDQPGRVTTWSAQGMLAKVYLTRAGLGQSGFGLCQFGLQLFYFGGKAVALMLGRTF